MSDFTQGSESRHIVKFAVPMLLGSMLQQVLYPFIASIMVGRLLGEKALAAMGPCVPIIMTIISLIIGIGMGATILISQYYGKKDYINVNKTIRTVFVFLFFSSLLLSVIGIIFTDNILHAIRLPLELRSMAKIYLIWYMAGFVVFFYFYGIAFLLRGIGDSTTPLYFLVVSTMLSIGFLFILIQKFKLGIESVSIAGIIGQLFAFAGMVIYLRRSNNIIQFNIFKLEFNRDIFYKCLKIGLPTGLQQTFVSLGMVALVGIVNGFGTNVIAAYSVAMQVDNFAFMPAITFGMALTSFTGQNLGAGRIERVRNGLYATMKISLVIAGAVIVIIILNGSSIAALFLKKGLPEMVQSEIISVCKEYFIIVCPFYLLFSVMFSFNGVMRGAGDTLVPMFLTLFSLWVIRIPLAIIFAKHWGYTGIWWSIPASWITGVILTSLYYRSGRWKKKVVVKVENLI